MTSQSPDTTPNLLKARRPSASAVPVLIRIPHLASARAPHRRARRRRLRREVRVAGYLLLGLLPISLAIAALGGDRLPSRPSPSLSVPEPNPSTARDFPAVSLSISLEPVVPAGRELETPVFLPGVLLPADSTEEAGDGGH